MDWSLLACGRSGHVTHAPDEPELRAQLSAPVASGEAWCCLRCGAFVPGPAGTAGPAAQAPRVRRGKEVRSALILRLFAVERFLRALVLAAAAFGIWRFTYARQSVEQAFERERPILRDLFQQLGYNIDHSRLAGLVEHALTLSSSSLTLLALGLAGYAAVELVEGVGLWLARRWGEYFAMVATSVGLPLEIYDLARQVTVTTLIFLAINLALVLYLMLTKRLFGVRGGQRAYQARLRSESIMDGAIRAAGAGQAPRLAAAGAAGAGVAAAGTPVSGAAEAAATRAEPVARDGAARDVPAAGAAP